MFGDTHNCRLTVLKNTSTIGQISSWFSPFDFIIGNNHPAFAWLHSVAGIPHSHAMADDFDFDAALENYEPFGTPPGDLTRPNAPPAPRNEDDPDGSEGGEEGEEEAGRVDVRGIELSQKAIEAIADEVESRLVEQFSDKTQPIAKMMRRQMLEVGIALGKKQMVEPLSQLADRLSLIQAEMLRISSQMGDHVAAGGQASSSAVKANVTTVKGPSTSGVARKSNIARRESSTTGTAAKPKGVKYQLEDTLAGIEEVMDEADAKAAAEKK
jgi:hypothetical protein